MEIKYCYSVTFLDVLFIHNPNYTLGHIVYWKATYTNKYSNCESNHRASQ